VQKLHTLSPSDRDQAADFVRQNYSWEKTFSRQIQVYAGGR